MPKYETTRRVRHSPEQMFALVADVEQYPQFLPMCEALSIRSRKERDGVTMLIADMTVGYSRCRVDYSTHAIGGLSENDFICAAKLDALFSL